MAGNILGRLRHNQEEIVKLYLDGLPPTEIGKQYGVSKPTVVKILKEAGVKLRSLSEAMKLAPAQGRASVHHPMPKFFLCDRPEPYRSCLPRWDH